MNRDLSLSRARCPVCGSEAGNQPWLCTRCQTPHHDDCAQYFGGCAIYGCRDSAPPSRIERALWPRALSRIQWLQRIRSVQSLVLTTCVLGPAVALFGIVLE